MNSCSMPLLRTYYWRIASSKFTILIKMLCWFLLDRALTWTAILQLGSISIFLETTQSRLIIRGRPLVFDVLFRFRRQSKERQWCRFRTMFGKTYSTILSRLHTWLLQSCLPPWSAIASFTLTTTSFEIFLEKSSTDKMETSSFATMFMKTSMPLKFISSGWRKTQ